MDTNDRIPHQNTTGQQDGHSPHDGPNDYPDPSELDAEQAFRWAVKLIICNLWQFWNVLIQSAVDAGKPDVAEKIKREFLELPKSSLPDMLRQTRDEFSQLWPRLQPILCEIKAHGLKAIDLHWPAISEVLNSMRERGYFSPEVGNEEVLADILQGDSIVRPLPPGHSLLHLFGVENEGEWNRLTPAQQQVVLYLLTRRKQPFVRIASRLLHRWAEDTSTSSVSHERVVHADEVLERIEAKSNEQHVYLSDSDRLSQFCELKGVDMDMLTHGDRSRILDVLHALDTGYDFASKQGMSMQAYYGDKADSEKTQRQRLFKKIKEVRDKAK